MESVLKLDNVSKYFKGIKMLENINFEIMPGEIFGLAGADGTGKTTLLKMITGLYRTNWGKIYICGNDLYKNREKALSNVGAVMDDPVVYGFLTGLENLKMSARLHPKVSKERMNYVINLLGMGEWIGKKAENYSRGMKERLSFAQAILHMPRLLVLDGLSNCCDSSGLLIIQDILKNLAQEEETAVLISDNNLSEMRLLCNKLGVLERGNGGNPCMLRLVQFPENNLNERHSLENEFLNMKGENDHA
jgi:ABC-2 type transport system ATP-binding protein